MAMMLTYLCTDMAESYSLMALFTWINLLQYLRLYPFFRFFVDLIKGVAMSADTWKFFIVMIIMVMAFSSALFILALKECNSDENCSTDFGTWSDDHGLLSMFYGSIYLSFGDFAMDPILEFGLMETFIFWFAVVFMCLIMLNLLIGILSEAMATILGDIEKTDVAALNGIIFDLESLMFWVDQDPEDEKVNA
jgi:hypothetical protein